MRIKCQINKNWVWGLVLPGFLSVLLPSLNFENQGGAEIITGAARLDVLLPMLSGKRVALVVNQTSVTGAKHLVDTLADRGVNIVKIFAPEHGFREMADAGETIKDGRDIRTGAPVTSLYGKKKKPESEDLSGADVVLFDIQDVGTRFYTYISTLFYVLEACAEQGIKVVVLDRPNPNGHYVDGPVLDMRFSSFIGIAPLPIVHGCTVGELARLYKGEKWIKAADSLQLEVVPCLNYTHQMLYAPPIKPSPNLPNLRSILLYPSLCFFEGTSCSLGRGTDQPFQVVGHPDFGVDSFSFIPRPNPGNKKPVLEAWVCKGWDFGGLEPVEIHRDTQLNLRYLIDFYRSFPNKPVFFLQNNFFEKLAGTENLRRQIIEGIPEAEIRKSWQPELDRFKAVRKKYLLYP